MSAVLVYCKWTLNQDDDDDDDDDIVVVKLNAHAPLPLLNCNFQSFMLRLSSVSCGTCTSNL